MATVNSTIVGNLTDKPALVQSEDGKFNPFYNLTMYQYTPGNAQLKVKLQIMLSQNEKTTKMISNMDKGDAVVALGCIEKRRYISPDGVFMSHSYSANFIKKMEKREWQEEKQEGDKEEEIIE